jgi:glycosyltransferase 2 family protein
LMSFGYSEVTGITFALIRRLREILWILLGLVCLMLLKNQDDPSKSMSSLGQ